MSELVPIYSGRVINPRNVEIERRSLTAARMSFVDYFSTKRRLKSAHSKLSAASYFQMSVMWRALSQQFDELMRQRAIILSESEINKNQLYKINGDIRAVIKKSRAVQSQMMSHRALAAQYRELRLRIEQHDLACERELAQRRAERILSRDVRDLEQIIITTLTNLRFCHRYETKGQSKLDTVRICERHATADTVYLKVETMRRGWFGWINALPYGVNPVDLASEDTVSALAIACQRQVEAVVTRTNGLWYRVHRLASADGIINFLPYKETLKIYDRVDRRSIPVCIGVGKARLEYVLELSHYPHYLIAGTSGSGKSNQLRNIICTLISNHTPDDVRLVLVDMKEGLEFKVYEDFRVPHLVNRVIKTPSEFAATLRALENLRAQRTEQFGTVHAVDIDQYNHRVPAHQRMPRIVVIVDEFAAIYMDNAEAGEKENKRIANLCKAYIRQLLAKARSAGIHVVICTQTVYVEILPGPDKANISVKMCGRMPTRAASSVVLDNGDAADLPDDPRGRMIVSTNGYQFTVQTPYVSPDDMMSAIEASKLHPQPLSVVTLEVAASRPESFTLNDVVDIALNEHGGELSADKIWRGGVRDTKLIEWRALYNMVNELKSRDVIEYKGQQYKVEKSGKGKRLILHSTDSTGVLLSAESVERL